MQYLLLIYLGTQIASAQVLRPPPFNLLNRPETIIETGNFIPAPSPTVISEPPTNSLVPLHNVASEPSTTIITDCSPSICKNLANTIQLMIVCNLLQRNKGSSELAMQLAAPIINEVLSMHSVSCGCANPLSSIATPNFITPNIVSPNLFSNSIVSSNILGPNGLPLTPTLVTPNSVCPNGVPSIPAILPNSSLAGQISNASGLLSTLMNLIGNVQTS